MFINGSRVGGRIERLAPNGVPRYLRIYDMGPESECMDRYTVIYTGRWKGRDRNRSYYRGMSENPTHPQGYGMWGESQGLIDKPSYAHLGRYISFEELPRECREVVLSDYCAIWSIQPKFRARLEDGGIIGVFDTAEDARLSLMKFVRSRIEKAKGHFRISLEVERLDETACKYRSVAGYQASFGPETAVKAIAFPHF